MTEITSVPNSNPEQPLAETSIKSLDMLFNMDPLKYTEQDICEVVKALRAKSAQWKIEEASGKKKSSSSRVKAIAAPAEFSLKDLEL